MKIIVMALAFMALAHNAQAQNLEVLNPKVDQGGVLIIRINDPSIRPACIGVFGKIFGINREGWTFIGIEVATPTGKKSASIVECRTGIELSQEIGEFEVLPKKLPVRIRGSSNPTPRWEKERMAIEAAYNSGHYFERYFDSEFIRPLELIFVDESRTIGEESSPFGEGHIGIDMITLNPNTGQHVRPVKAINSGRVVLIARNFSTDGNMIIIDHGSGIFSIYMHLSRFMVSKVGEMVSKGKIIGMSGRTGSAQGPHLHFSVKIRDENKETGDVYVDPLPFIETMNLYLKQSPQ